MLREGVEAGLIVLIVASFLRSGGRRSLLHWGLLGLGLAILLWLEYSGLRRIDESSWRQVLDNFLDTAAGLPARLGL
jgi:high-affinity Fe2+/Pb2+ permease